MPIICHHSCVTHRARGSYRALRNHHVISCTCGRSGVSTQTPGCGLVHSPSVLLYLAGAFHKAAGNAPSRTSANGRFGTTQKIEGERPLGHSSVNKGPRSRYPTAKSALSKYQNIPGSAGTISARRRLVCQVRCGRHAGAQNIRYRKAQARRFVLYMATTPTGVWLFLPATRPHSPSCARVQMRLFCC